MNENTKLKITGIVGIWERENFALFQRFVEGKKIKTENLQNRFAELKSGSDHFIERLIHELPADLYRELENKLDADEWQFFISKAGAIWFAKTFPQYRVAELV